VTVAAAQNSDRTTWGDAARLTFGRARSRVAEGGGAGGRAALRYAAAPR